MEMLVSFMVVSSVSLHPCLGMSMNWMAALTLMDHMKGVKSLIHVYRSCVITSRIYHL